LAEIAVWTLVYSSLPEPTLFQQIWTSVCAALKLSTTLGIFGYHAHTETCGASFFILLVQLVNFGLTPSDSVGAPLASPPLLLALVAQADSSRPTATAEIPAKGVLLFIMFLSPADVVSESARRTVRISTDPDLYRCRKTL
jgi:hypothetical protein